MHSALIAPVGSMVDAVATTTMIIDRNLIARPGILKLPRSFGQKVETLCVVFENSATAGSRIPEAAGRKS